MEFPNEPYSPWIATWHGRFSIWLGLSHSIQPFKTSGIRTTYVRTKECHVDFFRKLKVNCVGYVVRTYSCYRSSPFASCPSRVGREDRHLRRPRVHHPLRQTQRDPKPEAVSVLWPGRQWQQWRLPDQHERHSANAEQAAELHATLFRIRIQLHLALTSRVSTIFTPSLQALFLASLNFTSITTHTLL